jgi:flagellar hook-length control protein FliK
LPEAAPEVAAMNPPKAVVDDRASQDPQEPRLSAPRAPTEAHVQITASGKTVPAPTVSRAAEFVGEAPIRPEREPVAVTEGSLQPRIEVSGIRAPAATAPHDPAAGRLVAQQLAETMQTRGNGVVELALRPEELGRVRMVLAGSESQMTVVIQAERQGTEELIRRHLEQLQQDLQDIGYSSISFAFGDRAPEREAEIATAGFGPENDDALADEGSPVSAPTRHSAGGGMDIRM